MLHKKLRAAFAALDNVEHGIVAFVLLVVIGITIPSVFAAGVVSGNVFHDLDGNGTDAGAGEPGFRDVGVRIWNDVADNNVIDVGVDTIAAGVSTNSSGTYTFPSLPDGNYLVEVYDPTNQLGIGAFTDAGTDGILDTTIAGGAVSGQSIGFRRSTPSANGALTSTIKIDENTANGPGAVNLNASDGYGTAVASMGDLNGDGVSDIVVGAYKDEGNLGSGGIYIHYMNADGTIASTVKIDDTSHSFGATLLLDDQYGYSVANIGDLNGDGVQDIAVGAVNDEGTDLASGAIYIHFMNTDGTIDSTVKIDENTVNGPGAANLNASDHYGSSITNLGDLNGDGVQDIAVGAMDDEGTDSGSGAIYIHYMNTDGSMDSTVKIDENTANGPGAASLETGDNYGSAIANLGDLDGDGVQDIAVGASSDEGTNLGSGAIYIHYMNTDGSIDSTVKIDQNTVNGAGVGVGGLTTNDKYGSSIASLGDINNDGVQDIAVGAKEDDGTDLGSGAIYIHYMNTDGSINSTVRIDENTTNGPGAASLGGSDWYGTSIAYLGDMNGDGVTEILVGAMNDEGTDSNSGAVYLHSLTPITTPGIVVVQSGVNTTVTEGGASDTFTVALATQPTTDVVLNVVSSDTTSVTVSAATLTFTNSNWGMPQTITVNPQEDADPVAETPTVTISVDDASSDDAYDAVANSTVNVSVVENDVEGFTVNESGGTTAVTEGGATDSFTVVLTAQPASDVVFSVTSNDTSAATVDKATLTFTSGNWSTLQTVTVTAPEDIDGTSETVVVTVAVTDGSSDDLWDPLADQTVSVAVTDNDLVGIVSGNVFSDVNNDGTDAGITEPGLRDVGVRIWHDVANNNVIDTGVDTIVYGVLTNSTGSYTFPSLADGNFLVQVYDPTSQLGIGAFTDAGTDGIIDTTVAGGPVSGQSIGFHRNALPSDGSFNSTIQIDENTANGAGAESLDIGDSYGSAVANLGDLNNDGVTDMVVGAYQDEGTDFHSGAIYIHYMNADFSIASTVKIDENTTNGPGPDNLQLNDGYGYSVANIGDLNSDGVQDIAVGAYQDEGTDPNSGAFYIHFMNMDGTIDSTIKVDENTPNGPGAASLGGSDGYGSSLANLGDLDGDGVTDIAVGAYLDEGTNLQSGAIYIHYMNSDGTMKSTVKIDENTTNGPGPTNLNTADSYGYSLANIGDLNGDGVTDIAVGAMNADATDSNSGAVFIHFMNTDGSMDGTAILNEDTPNGPGVANIDNSDVYGSAIASLGDLNEDGVPDLVVGAMKDEGTDSQSGAIYIHYMNTDGTVDSTVRVTQDTLNGPGAALDSGDFYGSSIANLGDWNGDGVPEMVVGAQADESGSIFIHYFAGDGYAVSGNVFNDLDGNGTDAGVGEPGIRDVGVRLWNDVGNNNQIDVGVDTIVAGVITDSNGDYTFPSVSGGNYLVEVYDPTNQLGAGAFTDGGLPGVIDTTVLGAAVTGQSIGFHKSALRGNGSFSSTVKITEDTANGPGTSLEAGDQYGRAVANIGDLNNDGVQDIAVGARSDEGTDASSGAFFIHYMNTDGTIDSTVKIDENTANGAGAANLDANDNYGLSLTGLGDLNGDGIPDILVGAPNDEGTDSGSGAIYIHYMNTNGTIASTVRITEDTANGPGAANLDAFDQYGSSVANIGDLNNDGVQDIAVGAIFDEGTDASSGAIYVHFMNTDGSIDSTVKVDENTLNGPGAASLDASDFYGTSIAGIGDLNGDGVQDIAVGARQDEGTDLGSGAIYIHFMNTDATIDSTVKVDENTVNGPGASNLNGADQYGIAIANLGDLNGDGVQDIAVGADQDEGIDTNANSGAFYIHFMNTDGSMDSTVKIDKDTTNGPGALDSGDFYGSALANLGDLNNDGVIDIGVGAYNDEGTDSASGAFYIHYSAITGIVSGNVYNDIDGNGSDAGAGEPGLRDVGVRLWNDVGNNGVIDVGVDTILEGVITNSTGDYTFSSLADGNYLVEVYDPTNQLGVGAFTDAGTDGILDTTIALGANVSGQSIGFQRGSEVVDGSIASTVRITEDTANGPGAANLGIGDHYGSAVANIGDLNNDGVQDLLVGAEDDEGTDNGSGAAYIHFMNADGSIDSTVRITEDTANGPGAANLIAADHYGSSVAGIGDLNGDGVQDIVVGASDDEGSVGDSGAIYVHFMNTDGSIDSTVKIDDTTANGTGALHADDAYGRSVANLGDLNGDGVQDLVVGADEDEGDVAGSGAIYIHFMNTDASIDSTVKISNTTLNGPTGLDLGNSDRYGTSVANVGDLNNDGVQDIVVGARVDEGTDAGSGAIYIHYMNTDGSIDSTVKIDENTANGAGADNLGVNDFYGSAVVNLGDINDDGVQDLAVGAYGDEGVDAGSGAVYIHYMNTDGSIDSTVKLDESTTNGAGAANLDIDDEYGYSMANLGDLNGDGRVDLAVGARSDESTDSGAGTVYIHYLGGQSYGFTIAPAGDLALTEGATNAAGYTVVLDSQPATDVVIDISESSSAVTLNTSSLTFTNSNWDTPQNVSFTGTEDANLISEADQLVTFSVNDAGSDDTFDALADQTRNVDITDNDTAGFTITPAGDLALTEGATNATAYAVVLTAQPATDVVIDITEASAAVTLNTTSLTFTNGNWNVAQNVSISGTEDGNSVNEADQVVTFSINDGDSDDAFDAVADQTRNVDLTDNDTPGFTIAPAGDLALTEGATNTAGYTVVLNAQPATDVVIDISESSSAVTLNTSSITFTNGNWDTPQNVSFTGTEDANIVSEANQVVTFAINDEDSDDAFDAVADQTRNVDITDNDTAGFSVTESGGTTAVTEGGATDSFDVVLTAQPSSDVVFDISSNDTTSATVSAATLTFTTGNWDTAQTITVTGPQDADIVSETPVITVVVNDAGSDDAWDPLASQTVNVAVTDNDAAGFSVTESGGTTAVTEGGATDSFDVVLTAQPSSDVVFDISSNDTTSATVSAATLTFTTGNWNTQQTITVTAPQDSDVISETPVVTVAVNDAGSDNAWDALADQTVNVAVTDNDTAGFSISQSGGTTAVTEGGATDSFDVVLTAQPATDVVLNVASNDTSAATVSAATLTFTNGNWSTPQTITVTAPEDPDVVSETPVVTISVDDASSDNAWDPVADQTVNVTVTDNDTPNISITESAGSTAVTEGGATDTFDVVLTAQPTTDVVLNVDSSDITSGTASAALLTFTNGNWNTPQTITVTGPEDADIVSETPTITISVNDAASDDAFDAVTDKVVNVAVTDNDSAGFSVTESGGSTNVTEGGATDTFEVVLTAQPSSNVVFDISSSDTSAATVSAATLTFTTGNWNTPQTITVTAPQDSDVVSETPNIVIAVQDASSDNAWDPLANQTVVANVTDNDTAGFSISQSGGNTAVTEGGATDSFDVVLTAQPSSDVVLDVSSNDTTSATVSAATLTFTTGNWNTPQTITVTAPEDVDIVSETPVITVAVNDAGSDNAWDVLADQTVNVAVTDNDVPTFVLAQAGGSLAVTEGGATDSFTLVLGLQPATDVVFDISSSDTSSVTVSPVTITFTNGNWNVPQTVTVTAVDDTDSDLENPVITVAVNDAASDDNYDALADQTMTVSVTDDDTLAIFVPPVFTGGGGGFSPPQDTNSNTPENANSNAVTNDNENDLRGSAPEENANTNTNSGTSLPGGSSGGGGGDIRIPYIDLQGHWSRDFVTTLVSRCDLDAALSERVLSFTVFKPDEVISRGELVKLLVSCKRYNMKLRFEPVFKDLKETDMYAPYIMAARAEGIVEGYPDGTFRTADPVTREEATKIILLSHFTQEQIVRIYDGLTDVDQNEWYARYVEFAHSRGFISGYLAPDGTPLMIFGVGENITRAEATKIIVNVLGL